LIVAAGFAACGSKASSNNQADIQVPFVGTQMKGDNYVFDTSKPISHSSTDTERLDSK